MTTPQDFSFDDGEMKLSIIEVENAEPEISIEDMVSNEKITFTLDAAAIEFLVSATYWFYQKYVEGVEPE